MIKALRAAFGQRVEILALGTNAVAAAQMMKSGANRGASGENAIKVTAPTADFIIGTMSIVMADAMMGEITPVTAAAVSRARGRKLLLPLTQESVEIVSAAAEPLPHLVDKLIARLKEYINHV